MPVNRIQLRNEWNCLGINPQTDVSQYVVIIFFILQCVDRSACEHNSIKKQIELLNTESLKRCLSICCGIGLCVSVCGSIACEQNLRNSSPLDDILFVWKDIYVQCAAVYCRRWWIFFFKQILNLFPNTFYYIKSVIEIFNRDSLK